MSRRDIPLRNAPVHGTPLRDVPAHDIPLRNAEEATLSGLLTAADPVGDGGGLPPTEVARMRQLILAAARETDRARAPRAFWLPAAVVATAALALGLGLAWILTRTAAPPPAEVAAWPRVSVAVSPRPTMVFEPEAADRAWPDPPPVPASRVPEPAEPTASPAQKTPRRIDLTAPGGTRIVWVLDPDLELPTRR